MFSFMKIAPPAGILQFVQRKNRITRFHFVLCLLVEKLFVSSSEVLQVKIMQKQHFRSQVKNSVLLPPPATRDSCSLCPQEIS